MWIDPSQLVNIGTFEKENLYIPYEMKQNSKTIHFYTYVQYKENYYIRISSFKYNGNLS